MKNKLPKEYVSETNIHQTQIFKTHFMNAVTKILTREKKANYIHVPMYFNRNSGINSYWKTGLRSINFDTLQDTEINEVLQGANKWLRYYATINELPKGTTLVTSNIFCVRDSNTKSVVNNIRTKINTFTVGEKVTEDQLINKTSKIIDILNQGIIEAFNSSTFDFKIAKTFSTIDDNTLSKKYNHLLYLERIKRFAQENENVLLTNVWPFYEKKKPIESLIFDEWTWEKQGKYFHYYPLLKDILNLFQTGEAVTKDSFLKQSAQFSIILDGEDSLYYNMLKNGDVADGSMIEINVDEILMVVLKKINIGEINPSSLDFSFKELAKKKKINFV